MGVQKSLQDLNDLFIIFEDPKDKFVQLMDMAKESEKLTEIEKTDINKINGCTSQAWVVAEDNGNETYRIKTDSDALIVKGLLTILEKIFSGQPVDEILSINSNTSFPSSLKLSAIVKPVSATLSLLPGGSFICPYTIATLDSLSLSMLTTPDSCIS